MGLEPIFVHGRDYHKYTSAHFLFSWTHELYFPASLTVGYFLVTEFWSKKYEGQ
jgi:hypothetical protein